MYTSYGQEGFSGKYGSVKDTLGTIRINIPHNIGDKLHVVVFKLRQGDIEVGDADKTGSSVNPTPDVLFSSV